MQPFQNRELARLAGQRSGEARREKRARLPTLRELLSPHVEDAIDALVALAKSGNLAAIELILTYLYGKPRAALEVGESESIASRRAIMQKVVWEMAVKIEEEEAKGVKDDEFIDIGSLSESFRGKDLIDDGLFVPDDEELVLP
jgi:hypothetical protein